MRCRLTVILIALVALLIPGPGMAPAVQFPGQQLVFAQELAALQGTWRFLRLEQFGKRVDFDNNRAYVISGQRVTYEEDGQVRLAGKLVLNISQRPRQLDFNMENGDRIMGIYVRAGDYVIFCAGLSTTTGRPQDFSTNTPGGGTTLVACKIFR